MRRFIDLPPVSKLPSFCIDNANLQHLATPSCKAEPCDNPKTKSTRVGAFCFWPTRKDSNLRPSESESDALSSCATGRY